MSTRLDPSLRSVQYAVRKPLLQWLAAQDVEGLRVLDVGTGGADLPRSLARWAARRGARVEVLGIDPEPRAIAYARALPPVEGVALRQAATGDLNAIHDYTIAAAEASTATQLTVSLKNAAVQSFQSIMNMQV